MRKCLLLLLGLLACAPAKIVFALALVPSADDHVLAQATEAKPPFVKVRATAEKESGDGKQDVQHARAFDTNFTPDTLRVAHGGPGQ